MKLFAKRTLVAAAITAAVVGISATAVAQGIGGMDGMSGDLHAQLMAQNATQGNQATGPRNPEMAKQMMQKRAEHMAQRDQRMAQHQAELKAKLKLSAEQEPAWNAFVARTAPPQQRDMQQGQQREEMAKMTTPERLDHMQTRMNERNAEMSKRIEATRSFYSALTPDQQKVFDAEGHHGFQRAGMKGGRHGKGGHHKDHQRGMGQGHEGGHGMMQKRS